MTVAMINAACSKNQHSLLVNPFFLQTGNLFFEFRRAIREQWISCKITFFGMGSSDFRVAGNGISTSSTAFCNCSFFASAFFPGAFFVFLTGCTLVFVALATFTIFYLAIEEIIESKNVISISICTTTIETIVRMAEAHVDIWQCSPSWMRSMFRTVISFDSCDSWCGLVTH